MYSYFTQNVQKVMEAKKYVCCLDSVVQVYDIPRHKNLQINLRNVKDKHDTDAWDTEETDKVSITLYMSDHSVSQTVLNLW